MASFKNYLKDIEPVSDHMDYDGILKKFSNELIETLYISKEDVGYTANKPDKRSGYAHVVINEDTKWSACLRIGNHLPVLSNMFNHGYIPANQEWRNICLMFLGNHEFNNIVGRSERGNYGMHSKRTEIRLTGKINIDDIRKYYRVGSSIPYHIYHFVPELLVEPDVTKLVNSANEWLTYVGTKEYNVPDDLPEKAFNPTVISCYAIIKTLDDSNVTNEGIIIPKNKPKLYINMGTVRLIDKNDNYVDLFGLLMINSCSDEQLDMLKKLKENIEKQTSLTYNINSSTSDSSKKEKKRK